MADFDFETALVAPDAMSKPNPELIDQTPGGRRPGRPRSEAPKVEVKIRLDAKVVEHLRETGKGWQTRVNAELAKAVRQGRL